ncbi:MAG: alanine racemase [Trueperaceae bacterium]|nr:alanine racemase [Trueperaceae bacterium]
MSGRVEPDAWARDDAPDPMVPVAEVDLGALRRNVERLRQRTRPGTQMLVAVKADAYGHGLLPVARALSDAGVDWLGVAAPDEADRLRAAGIGGRILMFGPLRGPALSRLVAAEVDLTVTDTSDVAAVAAARATLGDDAPDARLHLKVDTGMGRLGLRPERATGIARAIADTDGLRLAGVWTHFACADEPSRDVTEVQRQAFEATLSALGAAGLQPELRHAANSAALLAWPSTHYDLVRPGLAVYGYPPGPELATLAADLEPVLTLTAPVVFVKQVSRGDPVSYGQRWRAPGDTTVATVRFGYADGYPRALTNLGEATLNGRRCRVVGTVCMDQLMLDAGAAEVAVGDRAILFGRGGPGADELAARIGTIPYELLTRLGGRVVRRYRAS